LLSVFFNFKVLFRLICSPYTTRVFSGILYFRKSGQSWFVGHPEILYPEDSTIIVISPDYKLFNIEERRYCREEAALNFTNPISKSRI